MQDGPVLAIVTESDLKVTIEKELVSQAEEKDVELFWARMYCFLSSLPF